jgi:hypothetical protein
MGLPAEQKVVKLDPVHGFASETTAATIILTASHFGMPVSTMYDWVNRRWVRTIVGLSERGKEQRLVPWVEVERLQGGGKEQLLQESARKLNIGSESEPTGGESEARRTESESVGTDPEPTASDSEATGIRSESVGIDWKWVARAEARRVRDLAGRARFLEEHLARAEARAEKAEERAEREGRELRLLIAQSVQAQQQTAAALSGIEERIALPAPPKAKWWAPWRR